MTSSGSMQASGKANVPVTFTALAEHPKWREPFVWPQAFSRMPDILADVYRRYLTVVTKTTDQEMRDVLLLGRTMMPVLTAVQYAHWIQAADSTGIEMVGSDILQALSAGAPRQTNIAPAASPSVHRSSTPWWIRRLARTRTWTPVSRLPRAMLFPQALALNHNALLRSHLATTDIAVRNAYDFDLEPRATHLDAAFRRLDIDALTLQVLTALISNAGLSDVVEQRLANLLRPILHSSFEDSRTLLGRLRAKKNLPQKIFTGTGSKRMSRAVGLEVMRRGGSAIRFDHGGSHILLNNPHALALNELAVSSRFVTATSAAAQTAAMSEAADLCREISECEVSGSVGDPGFSVGAWAFQRTAPRAPGRRRVLYVSTLFYGPEQQVSPPCMPAPLYLDWQLRLVAQLSRLPIDLMLKPHPGGLRPPEHSSPAQIATTTTKPFETAVADADVLIYDFPATTTFAVGLCTDRPIVLIDHGTMQFNASVSDQIKARCQILPVHYDERNLPMLDDVRLTSAIIDAPTDSDPSFFRNLFFGE